ncbi:MAG: hypothetical protein AAGI89_09305 [Pseudomonadota bacterium]
MAHQAETEAEERALKAWTDGERADMRDLSGKEKVIRGAFLAALLRNEEKKDKAASYKRFVLRGAMVKGAVDISHAQIARNLNFLDGCQFDSGFTASWAQLRALFFDRSRILGCLNLFEAKLAGQFSAEGAHFENPNGDAIDAQGVEASDWFMRATPEHQTKLIGSLDINGAKLAGQFAAEGAHFENPNGDAINAQGVEASAWFMRATPEHQTKLIGTLDINGAKLAGQFSANGARFENPNGDAINAQGVEASDWFMNATPEHQTKLIGTLDINGAKLAGQFAADGAHFENPNGNAIFAQGVRINGWFQRPLGRQKPRVDGTVSLEAATITGGLFAQELIFGDGDFLLENASIEGRIVFLAHAMTGTLSARRMTVSGEAKFIGQFDGHLDFTGAKLAELALHDQAGENKGPFMVEHPKGISRYFTAYSKSINLSNLHVDDLYLPPRCPTGGMDLSRAKIGVLHDTKDSWIPGTRAVDQWSFDYEDTDKAPITLRGLEYDRLENPRGGADKIEDRIAWLRRQPAKELKERFNPQPWRQLAKTLRRMGYDDDARRVRIAQRNTYRACKECPWWTSGGYWLLDILGGYGLRPSRTLLWSLGFIILSWGIFALPHCAEQGCFDGAAYIPIAGAPLQTTSEVDKALALTTTLETSTYPKFDALLYAIDVFIPLIEFGITDLWVINDQYIVTDANGRKWPVGVMLQWWAVVLRLLGAFLSAYLIAGFTAVMLRDEVAQPTVSS